MLVVRDVFMQPGEFCLGDAGTRIHTVLGSCVAVTLRNPVLRIGGMCHYMLPGRRRRDGVLSGKYADEALELLDLELSRVNADVFGCEVQLFGGGTMFAGSRTVQNGKAISRRNVQTGRLLLKERGFCVRAENLGTAGSCLTSVVERSGYVGTHIRVSGEPGYSV